MALCGTFVIFYEKQHKLDNERSSVTHFLKGLDDMVF